MPPKQADNKSVLKYEIDPTECPFREFRDNELGTESWGLGPAAFRAMAFIGKTVGKSSADTIWLDEQTQPLPKSVRHYLNGWIRAEDLAMNRWEATVVVFEDNNSGKMSIADTQLSHAQVLMRSSFCREMLSACFMLERVENFLVEHQWENFTFSMSQEGWRARHHIYSPGLKSGGGPQHRPGLSRNGCYLIRLYYLGAWRCVWVNDKVPVDATDSPLLPFSPLLSNVKQPPHSSKQVAPPITAPVVHLWPLLLCKALMKLAAPNMNLDEEHDEIEDESLPEFDIMHALTGCLSMKYMYSDYEAIWNLISTEVPMFCWDDEDDNMSSTIKSKSTKKLAAKESAVVKRGSITTLMLRDTKSMNACTLPGIVPGHEMTLLATMARDVPLKKPLLEPEISLWKHYRWIDWARAHGLYEAFDCPRTRFLKVNGLLKLSNAPHLLDVQSTESITQGFREENEKTAGKKVKEPVRSAAAANSVSKLQKEELREWIMFDNVKDLIKQINILYYPSMFNFASTTSSPPLRITKATVQRTVDIPAPKSSPIYLQIDSADVNLLHLSLSMLHPRVLSNAGVPMSEYIEKAYLVVEKFEWFVDCELPVARVFIETRGYDSVDVTFEPGRHFCRLWVHSQLNWHVALLSESALLLGTRDVIQCASVKECPWASRFLLNLGSAFNTWIRVNRSNFNLSTLNADKEFYKSYQPDLTWDMEETGHDKALLHWMFRQAVQSLLSKNLPSSEFQTVSMPLRRLFYDPDFGMPGKPKPQQSYKYAAEADPCDCLVPEEVVMEEHKENVTPEEKSLVGAETMAQLLTKPEPPITSQVCELATDDLPCGVLKEERQKVIRKHAAATVIQAYWRGMWARKCLKSHIMFTPEVIKILMDYAFGNLESLSALMNEFFAMYPELKPCYSVASALRGVNGLNQYQGTVFVTAKSKWVPFFQGVFYCHDPVKVHLDVQSSLQYNTIAIYNNDSGTQLSQAYNSHITFDIFPNFHGYTIMGHATLNQPLDHGLDANWQLTVLSSVDGAFHLCDNEEICKDISLSSAIKLHVDEIFIPNRRNVLGGIQLAVSKDEAVSFRAAASSSDLEMTAILRCKDERGESIELGRCSGKGELFWPYIRLEPSIILERKKQSSSTANLTGISSIRSMKKKASSAKAKSQPRIRPNKPTVQLELKHYSIELIGTTGWLLTLDQWKRVCEVRNTIDVKVGTKEAAPKKPVKEKSTSAKDKELQVSPQALVHMLQPGDAYVELECSTTTGGGIIVKRDDERDMELLAAIRSWDAKDAGRNSRGAHIRKEFRQEFLVTLPTPNPESFQTVSEEFYTEEHFETEDKGEGIYNMQSLQGPTPASESVLLTLSVETEEEATYATMPEQLKDKFNPLHFVPLCYKEKSAEECVLITPEKAEAAKLDRHSRIEAAIERMHELQRYNEIHVLGRQKRRCKLLERLCVDSQWKPNLASALEDRDDAIAQEILRRNLSATKKKQEIKKK